jgi:hypothetical protein
VHRISGERPMRAQAAQSRLGLVGMWRLRYVCILDWITGASLLVS